MTPSLTDGPAILVGYAYRLQIETEGPLFPEGCILQAQIRVKPSTEGILAELSSEDGGLRRLSDHLLELTIPATATAGMSVGHVVLDMVRRDVTPALPLGFVLEIPVMLPVTRGLS
jgi:hypothetical protein